MKSTPPIVSIVVTSRGEFEIVNADVMSDDGNPEILTRLVADLQVADKKTVSGGVLST